MATVSLLILLLTGAAPATGPPALMTARTALTAKATTMIEHARESHAAMAQGL